ncbi:MAG: helix-turn-helix domain-containing protein [Clostridia bacterium]|nr:helix-turn-helix domain-containing protein [Clostridia bacterium]
MNRLGKFLRKLRIEQGEVLFDMAQKLGVSSAFLSAVENDKRSAPASWIDVLAKEYQLCDAQLTELSEAIGDSVKQIRMDVGNMSSSKRNCALAFARHFDDFSDDEIERLMSILKKRRSE